jgi:hypothetical protein
MASVDGVYLGPLTPDDVPPLLEDVRAGRPPLPELQLARRAVADPYADAGEPDAGPPGGHPSDGPGDPGEGSA